jgi:hypothetical protein
VTLDDLADNHAQLDLLADVIESRLGTCLALEHGINVNDFPTDVYGRVFAAAVTVGDLSGVDSRITAISESAGFAHGWVEAICRYEGRTRMHDSTGELARELKVTGARYREVVALIDRLAELGVRLSAA